MDDAMVGFDGHIADHSSFYKYKKTWNIEMDGFQLERIWKEKE